MQNYLPSIANLCMSIPFKIAMYLINCQKSKISISNRLIAKPLCKFVNYCKSQNTGSPKYVPSIIHKIVLKEILLRTKITFSRKKKLYLFTASTAPLERCLPVLWFLLDCLSAPDRWDVLAIFDTLVFKTVFHETLFFCSRI